MVNRPHLEHPRGAIPVGLIGGGWIAEIAHLPALEASSRARLTAIVEPDAERCALLTQLAPSCAFPTLDELLADPGVPAVIVAVPTPGHATVAQAAFEAGKHVYIEKPLAASVDQGRRVVEAWRAAGTVGVVGYNFRHSPIARAAARTLASGELGDLVAVQSRFLWAADRIEGWRADPKRGGGCLLDLASHHIDLVTHLAGSPVATVRCTTGSRRSPEDSARLHLTLADGVDVQILASFVVGTAANRVDLFGTHGHLAVDLTAARPAPVLRPPGRGARALRVKRALAALHPAHLLRSPGHEPSFAASLDSFFEAIDGDAPSTSTPATGLTALDVVEAARASALADGAPVPVEVR
jgi:predicted dehydrogenase